MRLITITLTLFLSAQVFAYETVFNHPLTEQSQLQLEALSQKIGLADVMRGTFEQIRVVKVLKRPLKSSGSFIFSKKNGLMWRIQKPFITDVIMNNGKLIQRTPGRASQILDANDNPSARIMADVFNALFSQDQIILNRYFNQFYLESKPTWLLGLMPKDKNLAKVMARVVIEGEDKIQRIIIEEINGDKAEIRLFNVQTSMDERAVSNEFALFH